MLITRRASIAGLAALSAAASQVASAEPRQRSRRAAPLDAIVLGAGVSGLNAAWLLEREGLRVLTLEARQRVGGRVFTLLDQPGYPEMGFNSMGAGYGRGIDAAQRAGVELVDLGPRFRAGAEQTLALGGQIMTRAQWASSPQNPLPNALKGMMPWEVVPGLFSTHNPLKNVADWTAPESAGLDVPVQAFLSAQGLSDQAIQLVFDTAPYYGTSSHNVSALLYEFNDGWAKIQREAGPASYAVKGGNQQLPQAMARLLRGDVLLGKEAVALVADNQGMTVTCRDGSSYRAKRVICALPFSTLRKVHVEPALSGPQAQAVATLPYQPISIAFLTVKSAFWEADGHPASMWTDGPLGAVIAQRYGATDTEITGLSVFARGRLAQYWDGLGKDAALRLIVSELERLRPASRGQVTAAALHSWAMETFNAGDWAYFAPGQISTFVSQLSAQAGPLHFCGEHTAVANRGLEGALESSERAALEVLAA